MAIYTDNMYNVYTFIHDAMLSRACTKCLALRVLCVALIQTGGQAEDLRSGQTVCFGRAVYISTIMLSLSFALGGRRASSDRAARTSHKHKQHESVDFHIAVGWGVFRPNREPVSRPSSSSCCIWQASAFACLHHGAALRMRSVLLCVVR